MTKRTFALCTLLLMLAVSVALTWLVDATVQIDNDYLHITLFLLLVNGIIIKIAHKLWKKRFCKA
mgnify:CR=1 FL=1